MFLKDIPLFANLSGQGLEFIQEKASLIEYKKNQVIYEEGSPPSCFYCLVSGRVVLTTKNQSGNEVVLEYLHRGKYFGIISLLTGEPHSVTAKTINDCLILTISKEDFEVILEKVPTLALDLSRTLSRRLKRKDTQKTIFESTIISVISAQALAGKTVYVLNLALSLKEETHKGVIILDIFPQDKIPTLPQKLQLEEDYRVFDLCVWSVDISAINDFIVRNKFGLDLIFFSYKREEGAPLRSLLDILSFLMSDYHYIILDLSFLLDESTISILNQSDIIHCLSSPQSLDLIQTQALIERLKVDFAFSAEKIKVIINECKPAELSLQEQIKLLKAHPIFATLPRMDSGFSERLILEAPGCAYSKAVRRIARQEGDCLVGLALGIGVAYGFCHIGVLKVIEEEKIPIDIISGSSIGALIASLWATGKTSQEILELTGEFKEPKHLWRMMDFTFPFFGFIKGNRLYKFLKKYFGNKTFYDLRIPLKIVASDIQKKKPRIIEEGSLVDAIMASCSMPGVFKPFRFKEEILFDGGITYPLPTRPLFEIGVKKIIAVNVTPSREDVAKIYDKMKSVKTNIVDIIFSSIEIMQSEVAEKEAQLADIVLHPDTTGLHWLELHRAEEFVKRGEEEARRHLEKIWQIIRE